MFNPYTILGAVLVLIATAFGGAHVGKKLERTHWQKEHIAMQKQHLREVADQFRQYDSNIKLEQAKARKASEYYEKALTLQDQKHRDLVADIQRSGGLRIRVADACRAKAAPTPESPSTSGPDEGTSGTVRLPAAVERDLFDLAGRADKMSEQLRALQGWIRDNGHYGQTE